MLVFRVNQQRIGIWDMFLFSGYIKLIPLLDIFGKKRINFVRLVIKRISSLLYKQSIFNNQYRLAFLALERFYQSIKRRSSMKAITTIFNSRVKEFLGEKYIIYHEVLRFLNQNLFPNDPLKNQLSNYFIYWNIVQNHLKRQTIKIFKKKYPLIYFDSQEKFHKIRSSGNIFLLDLLRQIKKLLSIEQWHFFRKYFEEKFDFKKIEDHLQFLFRDLRRDNIAFEQIKFIYDNIKRDRLAEVYHNKICDQLDEKFHEKIEKLIINAKDNLYDIEVIHSKHLIKFEKCKYIEYFHQIMLANYENNPKSFIKKKYPFFSVDVANIFMDVDHLLILKDKNKKALGLAFARYCGYVRRPKRKKETIVYYMGYILDPRVQGFLASQLIFKFAHSMPNQAMEDIIITSVSQNNSIIELMSRMNLENDETINSGIHYFNSSSQRKRDLQVLTQISGMQKRMENENVFNDMGFIPGIYSSLCSFEPYLKNHITTEIEKYRYIKQELLDFIPKSDRDKYFDNVTMDKKAYYRLKDGFNKTDILDYANEFSHNITIKNNILNIINKLFVTPSIDQTSFLAGTFSKRDMKILDKCIDDIHLIKNQIEKISNDEFLQEFEKNELVNRLKRRLRDIKSKYSKKYPNFSFRLRIHESIKNNIYSAMN